MLTISDIMSSIITIDKDALLSDAAKKMVKHNRGSIIITEDEKTVGILTERDFLRLIAEGIDMQNTTLLRFYSKLMITADESTTMEEAAKIMEKHRIRRLPVTREGKIVGVVTANKIAKNMRYSLAERFISPNHVRTGIEAGRYR